MRPIGWITTGLATLVPALVLAVSPAAGQTATVRGFVTSVQNGEALQNVALQVDDFADQVYGAVTNGDGFFLFSRLSPGTYRLQASFIGFEPFIDTLTVAAGERQFMNIALREAAIEMEGIAVEADRESGAARVTAGMQSVRPEDIALIPAPDVSGDLASYMSTMPGIVTMGDRGGQVFIRGGEPTQNRTLLDGMDVYQPFHILGFYSAFPSEIISRADIYAGGFGSRYAGRISSVIDIHSRNGNKRALNASASVSPFTSTGHLEGPIIRDRVSFLGMARYSMLDRLAARYISAPLPYTFNDLFGKLHAQLGQNAQLSVSVLSTSDEGVLTYEDDFFGRNDAVRWRNTAWGIRYLVSPRSLSILSEVLITYSKLESEFGPVDRPNRTSDLDNVNVAVNMTNYAGRSQVNWGFYFRTPTTGAELDGLFQNVVTRRYAATHAGGYLEPDVYLGAGLHLRPGLGVQAYGNAATSFEPRLRILWDLGPHHVSAAGGLYRQQLVGLSDRRDATNIFTAWLEAPENRASTALHALVGYRVEPTPGFEASVEGFYKLMDHLFVGEWTAFPSFTTRLQQAHGTATGFDLRLEFRRPRVYAFANYGYSATYYEIEPDNSVVANPGRYRPPHDRRHQVNLLVATMLLGFDVSVRWQFGSGLPFTQVHGFDGFILMDGDVDVQDVRGFPRVIYESIPYRSVLPSYHRLDVSIERVFRLAGRVDATVHLSALNVYDRANIFTLDLLTARRANQLPIIPVIGLKIAL